VTDRGGVPEPIAGTELSSDAITQLWPTFLPDGNHFLYLDWRYSSHDGHDNGVWVGSPQGEKARRLPLDSTNFHYSEGYLLFSRDSDLVAQKFDLSHLQLRESVLPIVRSIQYYTFGRDIRSINAQSPNTSRILYFIWHSVKGYDPECGVAEI
jgi:hypothetical protein